MKFKNIKKKVYKKKSPSNSRTIPAKLTHFKFILPKIDQTILLKVFHNVLKVFVVFVFIVAVIIVGFDFQNNLQTNKEINSQREVLIKELNFWESFISKQNNYPDAYFQASILEYKLGDTAKAKMYAERGLALDPNSPDGQKLEKFLVGK